MLYLKNIIKTDTDIRANYYPENSTEKGFVCIDIKIGHTVSCELTSYDRPVEMYLNHAIQALRELITSNSIPLEKVVMWY